MPKILYIEDELTKNIATIKKFFAPVLYDKRILTALCDLENTDRVYAEDIINACASSSILDIAHTFPLALERVLNNHRDYDLILIDRNMSLVDYSDDLERILSMLAGVKLTSFDEDSILKYHEREGDFLLQVLLRLDPEYKNKTYFLTGNIGDSLRGSTELQKLIEFDDYTKAHIIEKGSPQESVISDIIQDLKSFRIQNQYRTQCGIIRKRLDEDDVRQFIEMIDYFNKDKRGEFIYYLRKLLDNLLHSVAFQMCEPEAAYWNPKNKKQLVAKSFIKGFKSGERYIGLPAYDEKHKIGYNSTIRNACLSIFEICSDCGVHELSKAIDIESLNTANLSKHTMNSLLNQMNDVIIWYDKAMDLIAQSL